MNNEENVQELNKRNTGIIEQALKDMYKKIQEQQISINGLNTTMGSVYERINVLEKMIMLHKAKITGTGPTVKE